MSKINLLLKNWPKNAVVTSRWLLEHGISYDLKKQYEKSGWIESIGNGASIRANDQVGWEGGLHALQYQLKKDIYLGGRSALEWKGLSHYVRGESAPLYLFIRPRVSVEKWFSMHRWDREIQYIHTNILLSSDGIEEEAVGEFKIKISSPERAILEMLCFTPKYFSLEETSNIMEHLNWLRADQIQKLLEQCTSYKGKRLFLFLAEYHNHPWQHEVNRATIDLGAGKRSLFKDGVFNQKYQITLPREFVDEKAHNIF